MKRCRWMLVLLLLAGVSLGAQSLDITAGGGSGGGGNLKRGLWPGFSATGWLSQNLGVEAGIAFNVGNSVQNYAAEANLAVRPAPMSWTPELLLGWARVQTAQTKCDNCIIPPFPTAYSLPTYNTFDLGAALKHYVSGAAFFQAGFRSYFSGGEQFGQPWRFAISVGYSFGRHS